MYVVRSKCVLTHLVEICAAVRNELPISLTEMRQPAPERFVSAVGRISDMSGRKFLQSFRTQPMFAKPLHSFRVARATEHLDPDHVLHLVA